MIMIMTRCDGRAQCPRGEDEEGCQIDPLVRLVLSENFTIVIKTGWHKLWQAGRRPARTVRIFEDQEVSQGVLSRSDAVLIPQSSILNPWSSVLNPQSSVLNPRSSVLIPQSSILDP